MGHEIFFKILDGPQNIFLCSFFVILFLSKGSGSPKYPNWSSRKVKKGKPCYISYLLSRYKTNGGKKKKKIV